MKASETFERYDGKVRECCNYAVRSSKSFMENADTNKRQPGGKAELLLREQLTSDLKEFCDEVDELAAIPERSGRFDGKEIGKCGHRKDEDRSHPVP